MTEHDDLRCNATVKDGVAVDRFDSTWKDEFLEDDTESETESDEDDDQVDD